MDRPAVSRDVVGQWFEAIGSLGHDIGIDFGRVPEPGAQPEWLPILHSQFDGVGAFAHLLGLEANELPRLKTDTVARWGAVLGGWLRYVARLRPTYVFQALPAPDPTHPRPTSVASITLDGERTSRVLSAARSTGITLNTLLLSRLSGVVRGHLVDPPPTVDWMIPVNMRGPVALANPRANHSSFVEVAVLPSEPEPKLQERVRAALSRNQHWAFWYAFHFGPLFGRAGRRLFMRLALKGKAHWVGSFSNLGNWAPPPRAGDAYAWTFCPPPVPSQPIGAGCLTYQGRLSLALKLHPCLTTDARVAEEWVTQWCEALA